ncbi:hypothetical protein LOK49_Contig145G00004 [Camellia lanceoleosa]|nr:hypothetical protein LOK49_Contig145G00004 [Camellia lanceoleosa]
MLINAWHYFQARSLIKQVGAPFLPRGSVLTPAFGELQPITKDIVLFMWMLLSKKEEKSSVYGTTIWLALNIYGLYNLEMKMNRLYLVYPNLFSYACYSVEKCGLMDVDQKDLMILVPPLFSIKDVPEKVV